MPIGSYLEKWLFPLCDPTTEDNPYGNDGCAMGPFWIMPAAKIRYCCKCFILQGDIGEI